MSFLINRRRLMLATSSAVAAGALSSAAGRAATNELRVVVGGGDFGKAFIEAYVKPFEAETGVKVIRITQNITDAQVAMMVTSNSVSVDVGIIGDVDSLASKGCLERIDYSIYKKEDLEGIIDGCKHPFGVGPYLVSLNMVYNTSKFPAGGQRPVTWADFWDVKKFPGARSLPTVTWGCWEEALLADGVPVDKLYPIDADRAFASLDKIKPHIRKWWGNGSEILQIMRDGVADLAECFDGRAVFLIDQGAPIEINRNEAKLYWDYLVIPKGSPNAENAQKFIEFTLRSDRQAAFAQLYPQAPSNRNAYKHLPETVGRKLCTYPEYMATSYFQNIKWYRETGSDGLTNGQRLLQRWNQWILK
ncbi:putative spermidine/putrescine transport system substrate-binding protein [Bradyrhizobium sp. LB14.3]|uniref:ABC transporter substrate-binding protein n=1 Tax=Bradyrhizobium sp. LB14.3 TaxID=3156328 RepID=UPI003391D90C